LYAAILLQPKSHRASAFSPAPFQCEFAVSPQSNPHPAHSPHSTYPAHKILTFPIPLTLNSFQKKFKKISPVVSLFSIFVVIMLAEGH
jgi:hypothetical protein